MDTIPELDRGREFYAKSAWAAAFESLSSADRSSPLDADDLELLARAAYMVGRDDDYVGGLERAHHVHLDAGEVARAARCAFWIGHNLLFRGERGRASGWFSRGNRLLEDVGEDCVERGYLLIPIFIMSPELAGAMQEQIEQTHRLSGATIHFNPDSPLPPSLVRELLRARLKEEAGSGA